MLKKKEGQAEKKRKSVLLKSRVYLGRVDRKEEQIKSSLPHLSLGQKVHQRKSIDTVHHYNIHTQIKWVAHKIRSEWRKPCLAVIESETVDE